MAATLAAVAVAGLLSAAPRLSHAADVVDAQAPLKGRVYAGCRLSLSTLARNGDPIEYDYIAVYSLENSNHGQLITNTTDYTGPVICTRATGSPATYPYGVSISDGEGTSNIATTTPVGDPNDSSTFIDVLSSEVGLLLQHGGGNRYCHTADTESSCFDISATASGGCNLAAPTLSAIELALPPSGNPTLSSVDVDFVVAYKLNQTNGGGPVVCGRSGVNVVANGTIESDVTLPTNVTSWEEALWFQYASANPGDDANRDDAQTRYCHTVDGIADCFRIFPSP